MGRRNRLALAGWACALLLVTLVPLRAWASSALREWEFSRVGDRQGWSVPARMSGAVMGGALWLTFSPKERDPTKLADPYYQIFGDWNAGNRIAAGEAVGALPDTLDIVSPRGLGVRAGTRSDQQLQVRLQLLNLSPSTDLRMKWRWRGATGQEWQSGRCHIAPDLKRWQSTTCYLGGAPRGGTLDQIAVGFSENVIRGDLWIRSISIWMGRRQSLAARPDLASARLVPRISVPGLSQASLAHAFQVLADTVVTDIPAYGFPYPFQRAEVEGREYGDMPWLPDSSMGAVASAWVDQAFAENVMRGFHAYQAINPDGRISGYPYEAAKGQPAVLSIIPWPFFESAYRIALRSSDRALRAQVLDTMQKFLDWWLSPVKRDRSTGLITGALEESPWAPLSREDVWGLSHVQSRAPVDLNAGIALAASLTAELAAAVGDEEDARRDDSAFRTLKAAINAYMWDEREGVYYDYDVAEKRLFRYLTVRTFFPLVEAIAPEDRRQRLLAHLTDPAQFNWGKTPIITVALTQDVPKMHGLPFRMILGKDQGTIVDGLKQSGRSDLAAEVNWSYLRFIQGNYLEDYFIRGVDDPPPERALGNGLSHHYTWTAASFITGAIEELFGVTFDAIHAQLRIEPCVPKALYGRRLTMSNLILPTADHPRLSLLVVQSSPVAARISVRITGKLPDGMLEVSLPGSGRQKIVRLGRSLDVPIS